MSRRAKQVVEDLFELRALFRFHLAWITEQFLAILRGQLREQDSWKLARAIPPLRVARRPIDYQRIGSRRIHKVRWIAVGVAARQKNRTQEHRHHGDERAARSRFCQPSDHALPPNVANLSAKERASESKMKSRKKPTEDDDFLVPWSAMSRIFMPFRSARVKVFSERQRACQPQIGS